MISNGTKWKGPSLRGFEQRCEAKSKDQLYGSQILVYRLINQQTILGTLLFIKYAPSSVPIYMGKWVRGLIWIIYYTEY